MRKLIVMAIALLTASSAMAAENKTSSLEKKILPTYFATLVHPHLTGEVLSLLFENPVFVVSNHPLHLSGVITEGELDKAKDLSSKHERTALINMYDLSASSQGLKQLLQSKEGDMWTLDIKKDKTLSGWHAPFMMVAAPYVRTDGGAQNLMMAASSMEISHQGDELVIILKDPRVKAVKYVGGATSPFQTLLVSSATFDDSWKPFVTGKNPNGFLIVGDAAHPTIQNVEFLSVTMDGDSMTIKAKRLDPQRGDLSSIAQGAEIVRVFVDSWGFGGGGPF